MVQRLDDPEAQAKAGQLRERIARILSEDAEPLSLSDLRALADDPEASDETRFEAIVRILMK